MIEIIKTEANYSGRSCLELAPPGEKCNSRDWRIIKAESSGSYSYFKFISQTMEDRTPAWVQIGIRRITAVGAG